MEGTEENVVTALRIEQLPYSDDIDNIKDDKLVKKIKEEQMIKKIRNEIETTVKKAHNCSEKEQQNEEKNISEIGMKISRILVLQDSKIFLDNF